MPEVWATVYDHVGVKRMYPNKGQAISKEPVLPHNFMVTSGSILLPRAIYGSVALQQPGSVLISVTPVATNDYAEAYNLGQLMRPYWF